MAFLDHINVIDIDDSIKIEDQHNSLQVLILKWSLFIFLIFNVLLTILFLFTTGVTSFAFIMSVGCLAGIGILYLFLWKAYYQLTIHIATLFFWAVPLFTLYYGEGMRDVTTIFFPLFFLFIAFIQPGPLFWGYSLTSILISSFIVIIELQGFHTNRFSHMVNWKDFSQFLVYQIMIVVVFRITAQKVYQIQQDNEWKDRIYREVFNGVEDAIMLFDAESGKLLEVNDCMLKMFRYDEFSEISSMELEDFCRGESPYRQQGTEDWLNRLHLHGSQRIVWKAYRKDGSEFWADGSIKRILIQGKRRFLAVIRDVDTIQNLEAQLRQAEKLNALGQLAGGIAHDFNNQLMGIQGITELLRNDLSEEKKEHFLGLLAKTVKRASELIENLLSFSRKGRQIQEQISLNCLLSDTLDFLKRGIDKKISLELDITESPVCVLGDSGRLENSVINLILNSSDAIRNEGRVDIILKKVFLLKGSEAFKKILHPLPEGSYAEIIIMDDGGGMDPSIEEKVFDPFFTTRRDEQGTGLGLSAVYGTMEQHKGSLYFINRPGEGVEFHLFLPILEN